MFRDRLRKKLRKAALKAFNMEWEASDRPEPTRGSPEGVPVNIPDLVDGSGDTPGPNHKEHIGRTWLSAQILSGVVDHLFDLRSPQEWASGHIPGATLTPGQQLLEREELLPDPNEPVFLYDADGGEIADGVGRALRERGWHRARSLQGGWAEWLEEGEEISPAEPLSGGRQPGEPWSGEGGLEGVLQGEAGGELLILLSDGRLHRAPQA